MLELVVSNAHFANLPHAYIARIPQRPNLPDAGADRTLVEAYRTEMDELKAYTADRNSLFVLLLHSIGPSNEQLLRDPFVGIVILTPFQIMQRMEQIYGLVASSSISSLMLSL